PTANEHAAVHQQINNDRVGLPYSFPFVFRQSFDETAVIVLWGIRLEAVFLARAEVLRAMARRGVHDAAALIERDVIRQHSRDSQVEKRVLELDAFQFATLPRAMHLADLELQFIGDRGDAS